MIDRDAAKAQILTLFRKKKVLDYYDIMVDLDMDLEMIVEICKELESECKIEEV